MTKNTTLSDCSTGIIIGLHYDFVCTVNKYFNCGGVKKGVNAQELIPM